MKNRIKANLNLVYVTVTSIVTWIVLRSLFSQNEINYAGTQFAPLRDILQTLKLTILGTFPSAAWDLSELFISTKSFGFFPTILPTLFGCTFSVLLVQYFRLNFSKKSIFAAFILIFLWIGSAIFHSISIKNAIEISQLGMVYFSYGVGFAFFEDDTDWRWRVAGLKDFYLPRGIPASDSRIEFCCARRSYYAHELYQYIKDPKSARAVGWDVDQARQAIINAVPADVSGTRLEWEEIQVMLKDNDLSLSFARSAEIQTIHYYVREGRIP
jgi:hypothetical protein